LSENETALRSVAEVRTATPSRFLQQLCKHFRHKREVAFGPLEGRIGFEAGNCVLRADEAGQVLHLEVRAGDRGGLAQLENVVARHLLRFAFREPLEVTWSRV
jgi:hypothetical protein